MKQTYRILLLVAFSFGLLGSNYATAQQKKVQKVTVASTIVDENGVPIAGATIYGQEGAVVTVSDKAGKFSFQATSAIDVLVEAQGYEPLVVGLVGDEDIVLEKAPFLMSDNDIVNIAYGQVKKGELVSSVSVINAEEVLKRDNVSSVEELINTRALGMLGTTNMRGIGDALVVIDGLPRDISTLNVEEIDQITILKDVNSSVLYGTQAQNGVINITTKRGQAQKRVMNLFVEQGISTPTALPSYLSSADYMTLYNEALANDGLDAQYDDATIAKYRSGENIYRYPDVDYYSDEFLNSFRNTTRLFAEFSGGSKNTRYYTNLGWTNEGSLLNQGESETSNRFNVRGNIDFKASDIITAHVDAVVVFDFDKSPNGDFWSNAATLHPYYYSPLIPTSMVNDESILETAKIVKDDYILGGTTQYMDNVYGNLYQSGYTQNVERTAQFNGGVDVDLNKWVKGLQFKTNLNFDFYNQYYQSVTNTYAVYSPEWNDEGEIVSLTKINDDYSDGVQELSEGVFGRTMGFNAMFDYNRTFNDDHNVSATLLGYYNSYDQDSVLLTKKYAHLGLRATYNYQQRYFVDFSSAYSHSVKLHEDNRGGYSPTLGAAWVVTNEDFWEKNDVLNYLKVKASAGILQTDVNISENVYNETYWSGDSYSWGDGSYSGNITWVGNSANPNLAYEKISNIDLGFESYWFGAQLGIEANYFRYNYYDQVVQRYNYYPSYVSALYPYENYEEDMYTGAEIGVTWYKTIGEVSLALGANLMYADSEVIVEDEVWANDYQYRTGNSYDATYGFVCLGFFEDEDDIANSPTQQFGEVAPGDLKYADLNDDKVIDENDMKMIGNTQARLSYGLNLNVQYKNFSLFIQGEGRSGYDYYQSSDYFWVDGDDKYSEVVLGRWTPETAETATYPRLTSKTSNNNYQNSTFWLKDGRYFSLNNVQLTYDFSRELLQKISLKGLSLYVRGSNLLMISEDSEYRQLNIGSEPQYRNFALGSRIKF